MQKCEPEIQEEIYKDLEIIKVPIFNSVELLFSLIFYCATGMTRLTCLPGMLPMTLTLFEFEKCQ